MFSRFARTVFLLVLLQTLAGAGPSLADDFAEALERGSLRVGVALFTPWTMRTDDGTLKGFEIDVARQLARDMGIEAEFRVYEWDEIIDAVNGDEIDLVAGGMAITPQRALQVEFSRPYSESGVTLVTNTAVTEDVERLAELNSEKYALATVTDTLADSICRKVFDKAVRKGFQTPEEAEKAVLSGEVAAYVVSVPEASFLVMKHPDTVDLPLAEPLLTAEAAFAVKRGEQALLNYLDAWITARTADRWLPSTYRYWFADPEARAPGGG